MNQGTKRNYPRELEEELKEANNDDDDDQDGHEDGTHESVPSSRHGKSALPDCWSRIIKV